MPGDVETKLSAARTRLILDKPFLGALVLRLPLVAADPRWCHTTATDARSLYYNADYVDALSAAETQFVLAHEALHCALSHFARRAHRVKHRWDLACDLAINPLLLDEGLTMPPEGIALEQFEGLTAEEIYPALDDTLDQEPMDQHIYDAPDRGAPPPAARNRQDQGEPPGAPQPPPLGEVERETLQIQWQQRLAGAAQQARQAGKMDGAMARLVDHLLQPRLPWRMLLARYMTGVARDDYSYTRPSRREGDAILPSLRSRQTELVVIIDTSASVSDDDIREFLAEIDAIKGQIRARIHMHACDAALNAAGPWVFEPWESIDAHPALCGGGGTDFSPAFAWAERLDRTPDLLVYFTDAAGTFPSKAPHFPVLWLVKGRASVPWGIRVQLN